MSTLVMVGNKDLPRPVAESLEMLRLIPGAKLVVVKNAAHISNFEQPEFVTKTLEEFIRTCFELEEQH